ncbi:MAG: S-methyl-5-thioribose-1-phosphate isomerase [candidate division Zixibacteria bacterium HGW-Zixibacteria-1]|nr:MAG: S-methyl-5-thioribose-1-phosphate isomerase [candidate division Zixibacteria bacterium HGW-Zixibacteria-1]
MNFTVIERVGKTAKILDQTQLPTKLIYKQYNDYRDIMESIRRLEIRGAPAIGIAGAFAVAVAAEVDVNMSVGQYKIILAQVAEEIKAVRPTAVNLGWGVDRVVKVIEDYQGEDIKEFRLHIWAEAEAILKEDKELCDKIGQNGAALINDGDTVLTHCNAGALATGGIGTALAVIYAAKNQGKNVKVYADETRPLLQGARLTSWELMQEGIDVTLICDNMAAMVMKQGKIDKVIVGTDRVAKNGDVANKIGTYGVAVLAREHNIPFYVALPYSTFDNNIPTGDDIPIEERSSTEITDWGGVQTAPDGVKVYSPAFDITPRALVTAYITDQGVTPGGRGE